MNNDITDSSVSVIGLGKLGASLAAVLASRGFSVVGVDVNESIVRQVNEGQPPVQETGLAELIARNRSRLRATMSVEEAVRDSSVSFVVVPTPSDHRGAFAVQYAAHAFAAIGRALRQKNGYHLVVLTSTVLPGSVRHALLPLLEQQSGKRCGVDFGLCYNPEFIALGSVIRDLLNPDFHLIGEFDAASGDRLEMLNRRLCCNNAPSRRMSIENAELSKIALNSYVTLKISFANMLADLCERLPGGDVDVVSDALGLDTRIGRKYLTGGLGFGGPCFPRDNVALSFIGEAIGADCSLLQVNDRYNRHVSERIVQRLKPWLKAGDTVAVLGLAYKPQSDVVEESPGIALARALADAGLRVVAYDPLANHTARTLLQENALVLDSLADCLRDAATVLVATPDETFRRLTAEALLGTKSKLTVIDFWRVLEPSVARHPAIRYLPIGRCVDPVASEDQLRGLWQPPLAEG